MQTFLEENGRMIMLGLIGAAMLLPWFLSQARGGSVQWMEIPELVELLKGKNNVTVIDVRTRAEFTGPLGNIKRAMNIPLDELGQRMNELSALKDKPIVLVCRTDRRASAAAGMLERAGMTDVKVLRGGMTQWSQTGR